MDFETARGWVSFLLSALSLAGVVWALLQSPAKKNADALVSLAKDVAADIDKLDTRLDAAEMAIGQVQNDIRHLPDRDSAHRLELGLSELRGEINTLNERLKPVAAISERMQELMVQEAAQARTAPAPASRPVQRGARA